MNADELLALVAEREAILDALTDGPLAPRDVVERVDTSRSTFNRAIRELAEAGLVDRTEGECALTLNGRLLLDRYRSVRREVEGVAAADRALAPLGPEAPVDPAVLVDAEVHRSDGSTPYRPEERLHEVLRGAARYRAVLPALDDPRHVRLLYEHVVTDGRPAELVVPGDLVDSLAERFPRRLAAMAETDGFEVRAGDVPAFGLVVADAEDDGEAPTVALAVFGDHGIHAVIVADGARAHEWATDRFEEPYSGSRSVGEQFRQHTDGGVILNAGSTGGPALVVDLEREGFVRLSREFFAERRVADPATAWRAGLDLAEVHTGYAVERTVEGGDGETLTERLTGLLLDDEDCVVVGPPGSGKSTTCKRVASEWYSTDRGPVFYRESGRGTGFESVEELVATVESADGRPLVVVEDAVRPEAVAVFEAIERTEGAASFLLDARESEWRDPPERVVGHVEDADVRVETMPPLDEADRHRFVEQFERTVGTDVSVPVERVREWDRSSSRETAPGETQLLLHRLATYADPLADGETTLEASAAAVYENAADDDGTLDVAVAANLLNAAGVSVGPGLLWAVADDPSFEAALDLVRDRVLFGLLDGAYRTVHETWSVAFLDALLSNEDEKAARERVCRVASRVLGLADDPSVRDEARSTTDGAVLDRVVADPSGWADRTVEALFTLGRERPKFAVLLGDADGPGIEIPAACESTTEEGVAVELGRTFLDAGEYDRATAIFEDLSTEGRRSRQRLLGLATAHERVDEHDAATDYARRCLSLADEAGDRRAAANAHEVLGDIAFSQSDYDRAADRYERALATAREIDDRRLEGRFLHAVGRVAEQRAELDSAREYYDRSLAAHREVGDRRGEATVLKNLGTALLRRGDLDGARRHTERALEILRGTGDRQLEARVLHNLGTIALRRDAYDRAREFFERSLETKREIGDVHGEATTLSNLGVAEHNLGNLDRAVECCRQALDINRDLGHRHSAATCHSNLGSIAIDRCEYDSARESFRRSLEIHREIGDRRGASFERFHLGEVAERQGRYEQAREHYEASLEIRRELGARQLEAESLAHLGRLAFRLENDDEARRYCERALEIARDTGSTREAAKSLQGLASLARRQDDYERAKRHVDEAISLLEESGQRQVPQARLEASRIALARGDGERAVELASAARESFADLGSSVGVATSRLVLGRAAAAAGDHERAREHWEAAFETFDEVGAPDDALRTLRELVDHHRELDDDRRAREWHERARAVLSEAPEPTAGRHREWVAGRPIDTGDE